MRDATQDRASRKAVVATGSSARLGASMRAGARRTGSLRSTESTATSAASPSGRLIQKIHCHPRCSVSAPPTVGPSSEASAHIAEKCAE